jgi:hypothetical protein
LLRGFVVSAATGIGLALFLYTFVWPTSGIRSQMYMLFVSPVLVIVPATVVFTGFTFVFVKSADLGHSLAIGSCIPAFWTTPSGNTRPT